MRVGFEEYFDLSEADFKELWESATFVFDTNALLSLFRDKKTTSDELIKIMTDLSERVWIPHQVACEFHKNKLGVVIQNSKIYSPIRSAVDAARKTAIDALGKVKQEFKHHPVMNGTEAETYINKKFDEFIADIDKKEKESPTRDYYNKVFEKLVSLLEGTTGEPYTQERMKEILSEGAERCSKQIPPGFVDYEEKKNEEESRRLGDFIIWKQVIDFSLKNKKNIIFITDDVKDDWWRRVKGEMNGPRVELVKEFRDATASNFYMYTRYSFLKRAKDFLKLRISSKTIEDVKIDYLANAKHASEVAAMIIKEIEESYKDVKGKSESPSNDIERFNQTSQVALLLAGIAKEISEVKTKIEYFSLREEQITKEMLSLPSGIMEANRDRMVNEAKSYRSMRMMYYNRLLELIEKEDDFKKKLGKGYQ